MLHYRLALLALALPIPPSSRSVKVSHLRRSSSSSSRRNSGSVSSASMEGSVMGITCWSVQGCGALQATPNL